LSLLIDLLFSIIFGNFALLILFEPLDTFSFKVLFLILDLSSSFLLKLYIALKVHFFGKKGASLTYNICELKLDPVSLL